MVSGRPKEFTATGSLIAAGATQTTFYGFTLSAGVDAASATLRDGGASGTVVLVIKAPIQTTTVVPMAAAIQDPHVTLTGTSPSFTAFM